MYQASVSIFLHFLACKVLMAASVRLFPPVPSEISFIIFCLLEVGIQQGLLSNHYDSLPFQEVLSL